MPGRVIVSTVTVDRVGVRTGVYSFVAPRQLEFGLRAHASSIRLVSESPDTKLLCKFASLNI